MEPHDRLQQTLPPVALKVVPADIGERPVSVHSNLPCMVPDEEEIPEVVTQDKAVSNKNKHDVLEASSPRIEGSHRRKIFASATVQVLESLDVAGPSDEKNHLPIQKVEWRRDIPKALLVALVCLVALVIVCAWDPRRPRHDVHHVRMNSFQAHVTSPLYAISKQEPLVIPMEPDKPTDVLDIKIITPCVGYCRNNVGDSHRRLAAEAAELDLKDDLKGESITWELLANGHVLVSGSVQLAKEREAEAYAIVKPDELGAKHDDVLTVRLTTASPRSLGVLCQVLQLGVLGKYRILISAILFVLCFGLILSEVINRCYATFIGAISSLFLVCITYETPSVATVMGMIDFGTLLLLCTMMMIVHILAITGFFEWVAVRLAALARGDARLVFFIMANCMGWMSCILPNVTCVMLVGPITISLCKQMGNDPVPFYLAQTICSTIGGTTTLIGDPPNLVIGHKLKLRFVDFIIFNGPCVFIILPLASAILYWRFRHRVGGISDIDLVKLKKDNPIRDEKQFLIASVVFGFVTLGLFTTPIHELRPCWFCFIGFFFMAMVNTHHEIKSYLAAVQWDTLLFFANLFIFVECLAELGMIKAIGVVIADIIASVDEDSRLPVAVVIVLWVSTLGSAFLESLPFTTTFAYILADLRTSGDLGIPVEPLCWALSMGACVGGIGSIMGSSANLVALSVSEKYSPDNPIKGSHFLCYGFPTLLKITVISTFYQLLVFCVIKPYT